MNCKPTDKLNQNINIDRVFNDFETLVVRLRSKAPSTPSLEEITKEVELVRAKRYAK